MTKQLSDLRRARGKIQEAYSKIIGRFGTQSEILDLLTEALALIKAADVPGGIVEVEAKQVREPVAAETESIAPVVEEVSVAATETEAEPPPTKTRRGMGRKK